MDTENSRDDIDAQEAGNITNNTRLDDEVVQRLLSAINGGSAKNKQLQTALGVSSGELDNYLKELVKDELVGFDIHDGTTLKLTEKGLRFLISYERVLMSKTEHQPPKGLLDIR